MTYSEVASMLDSTNIPYAYYQFTANTAVSPPFICYYYSDSNDLAADDTNYQKIRPLVIELYTDAKDFVLEQTVEDMLSASGFVFSRSESSIDTERMYMVVFNTTVVIEEETNNGQQN